MSTQLTSRVSAALIASTLVFTSIGLTTPAFAASTPSTASSIAGYNGVAASVNVSVKNSGAHKVYAVLATPSNVVGAAAETSQTALKVADSVSAANTFWKKQSSGTVSFALAGVSSWSRLTASCATGDPTAMYNEAKAIATAQLGYKESYNTHLAIFFPSNVGSACGAAIGGATLGTAPNSGGSLWTVGSDSAAGKAALARLLGRNLSLGGANYLDCTAAAPDFTSPFTGCTTTAGGDVADVQGNPSAEKTGGSLSAPSAIRSGLWTSSAYAVAPQATTTYKLKALSAGSGLRSVVIEDKLGINYFVEYRNFTGSDAQLKNLPCVAGACAAAAPGIRVLRLEGNAAVKGSAGDSSLLLGRTVAGVRRVNYLKNETFTTSAASGISVSVTDITSTTATISVTRATVAGSAGAVTAVPLVDLDRNAATYQVGDTWTAQLGSDWKSDSYTFQWYRSGVKIVGATKQNYTFTKTDLTKVLSVKVIGKSKTTATSTVTAPATGGIGPVTSGVLTQGAVSVGVSGVSLAAVTTGWFTPSTTFKYQWKNAGVDISKATKSTYKPTASQSAISVVVTATRSGFNTLTATSAQRDYTTETTGTLAVSTTGTARVGSVFTVNQATYTTAAGPVTTPVLTYQWYRGGKSKISGATNATYTATSTDFGKTLTVKVSGGVVGNLNPILTSSASATIAIGVVAGTKTAPVITVTPTQLESALPVGSVTEAGVTTKYQWYRNGTKITNAVKSTYKLVAADAGANITVVYTITKTNYTTVVLTSLAKNYTVAASGPGVLSSNAPKVGTSISVTAPAFTLQGAAYVPASGDLTYQWYVDGALVTGATAASYVPTSDVLAKTLSVKITAAKAGYLPVVVTLAATTKVAAS